MIALKMMCAVAVSTATVLLLTDSSRSPKEYLQTLDVQGLGEVKRLNAEGRSFFIAGNYSEARDRFLSAVTEADRIGDARDAALNWNNAGSSSLHAMQYRRALQELTTARQVAERAHEPRPLGMALNNLASLYLQMGEPDETVAISTTALRTLTARADQVNRARLQCEIGAALMQKNRPDEALRYYREGINALIDVDDLEGASLAWGMVGDDSLRAGNMENAERAYVERLRLVRTHHLQSTANLLCALAKVTAIHGDRHAALALFDAALEEPPGPSPRWKVYSDRGRFYLDSGRFREALSDFRQARDLANRMRADMVPADLDRVNFENGLRQFLEGLVDAGNLLAHTNGDRTLIAETFEAAEQDRLWSLRSLVPAANDWRSGLPDKYWEVLARYQAAQRTDSAKAAGIEEELRQIEIAAAPDSAAPVSSPALAHVRSLLDSGSVLISFHISKTSSWVWAADQQRVDVYPLPPLAQIDRDAAAFAAAVRSGSGSDEAGARLFQDLFGAIDGKYLRHPKWRLELDGPLYEVPFSALVADRQNGKPVYLVERASIESVPGALLMTEGAVSPGARFLAIGDPVYNSADPRYRGPRAVPGTSLPRLPNTAAELESCARSWNSSLSEILTGPAAAAPAVEAAVARGPEIIHFATHVVSEPGAFRSGLIALSLDPSGAMGLLGPKEIVARRVSAKLVVMNGCHSAQGKALAGAGLMGLTRAWIGAGASAVIATQWDIPDGDTKSLLDRFYSSLRLFPERGVAAALRDAQLSFIRAGQPLSAWAAYSLLSRIP